MSTNFPRVFPMQQLQKCAKLLVSDTDAKDWHENLRDINYAMGTVLTAGIRTRMQARHAEAASAMQDSELAEAVQKMFDEPTKVQRVLRLGAGAFLTPELLAMILEMLLRLLMQHKQALGTCFAATEEAPVEEN